MAEPTRAVRSLEGLGFSEYEARTYAGLLNREPLTGYGLSKLTGIPQPKVYETLNRLAQRGAVVQVGKKPARWVALPLKILLKQLESDFSNRLVTAQLELSQAAGDGHGQRLHPAWALEGWDSIRSKAEEALSEATERVYVSAHNEHLSELAEELQRAEVRGVRIDVLAFGELTFDLGSGYVLRHRSTEGILYPRHQSRHLALVADSTFGLWALAPSGVDWTALWVERDGLIPALIKGYIRHDMYVQRIYADVGDVLHQLYGPSLERLARHEVAADEQRPQATGKDQLA